MQIRAYLLAVEGIAYEAIARAARMFLRGEVRDHNKAFAPSCAEFAEQSRYQALCMEAERKAGLRTKIEAPKDEGPRVDGEKFKLLKRHLQGDQSATAELKRLYPANEIIAMADTPVKALEGEQ